MPNRLDDWPILRANSNSNWNLKIIRWKFEIATLLLCMFFRIQLNLFFVVGIFRKKIILTIWFFLPLESISFSFNSSNRLSNNNEVSSTKSSLESSTKSVTSIAKVNQWSGFFSKNLFEFFFKNIFLIFFWFFF